MFNSEKFVIRTFLPFNMQKVKEKFGSFLILILIQMVMVSITRCTFNNNENLVFMRNEDPDERDCDYYEGHHISEIKFSQN